MLTLSYSLSQHSACIPTNQAVYHILPLEIITHIFSYLSCLEQAQMSRVCRTWHNAAQITSLDYGKVTSVLHMAQVPPRNKTLFESPHKEMFCLHRTNQQYTLFSHGNQSPNMYIADKKFGGLITLDLRETLDKKEQCQGAIRTPILKSVILLSTNKFITATLNGAITYWEICHKTVRCIARLQIFSEETNEVERTQGPYLEQALVIGSKLCVEGSSGKRGGYQPFLSIFDVHARTRLASYNYYVAPGKTMPPQLFACHSSRIFDTHLKGNCFHLRAFHLSQKNTIDPRLNICLTPDVHHSERFATIVGLNDQWIVVAQYYQNKYWQWNDQPGQSESVIKLDKPNHQIAYFHIFDAHREQEVFKFHEDFSHLSNKFEKIIMLGKTCWLCNDFFAIWIGNAIKIWHLPCQRYLTSISLEDILTQEQMDDTYASYQPILELKIYNSEIQMTLQNIEGTVLHMVTFEQSI